MVDNDRDREPLRGYFEFFKHLSTLSTLVLVVSAGTLQGPLPRPRAGARGSGRLRDLRARVLLRHVRGDGRELLGTPPRRLLYVAVGGLVGAVLCLIAGIATAGVF